MSADRTLAPVAEDVFDYSSPGERENLEVVQAFYDEVFNRHDSSAAERFFGPGFVQHNPLYGSGVAGFRKFLDRFLDRFPNLRVTTEVAIAQNDRVFFYTSWRGRDVRTGRPLALEVADVHQLWQRRIVEHWDRLEYTELQNFGLLRPVQEQPTTPIDRTGTLSQQLNLALILSYLADVTFQDTSRSHLYLTKDFRRHDPTVEQGLYAFNACIQAFRAQAPDLSRRIDHLVVGNRHVGAILTSSGHAPNTGALFVLPAAEVYQVEGGMFTEQWGLVDFTDFEALIGFNPLQLDPA